MSAEEDFNPFLYQNPSEQPVVRNILLGAIVLAIIGLTLWGIVSDVPKLETPPAPAMLGNGGF
jgi:hypothetical protein